jgi:hypothetical protein
MFQPTTMNPVNFPSGPRMSASTDRVIEETRAWVRWAVVGLNLCPFAKAPFAKAQIRYAVCEATDAQALLDALCLEMHALVEADPAQVETTLVVHPNVLEHFADFNDFLDLADLAVEELGYGGVLQVASFHPHYQFADAAPEDMSNATNRSPYPTLHLLREESVDRAVAAFPEAESIYEVNIRTMNALGAAGWSELQARCKIDACA